MAPSSSQPAMGTSPERTGEAVRGSAGGMDSSSEPPRRPGSPTPAAGAVREGESPGRATISGSPWARATPVTSLTTSGLARMVIRPIVSHPNGGRASVTRRSVDQRRTDAQVPRRGPLRSGRRFPSPVEVAPRTVAGIEGSARAPKEDLPRRPDPEALPPFPWQYRPLSRGQSLPPPRVACTSGPLRTTRHPKGRRGSGRAQGERPRPR